MLQEVDEAEGAQFRLSDDFLPLPGRHVQVFREIVVGADGPVEHDVPVRQPAVGKHHFRAPELLALGIEAVPVVRERVVAAVPVQVDVIAFGFRNGYGFRVFLEDGDVGKILGRNAVIQFFGSGERGDIAQFGSVDKHPGPCPGSVGEGQDPSVPDSVDHLSDSQSRTYFDTGPVGHVPKDFCADGWIEQDVGHPA